MLAPSDTALVFRRASADAPACPRSARQAEAEVEDRLSTCIVAIPALLIRLPLAVGSGSNGSDGAQAIA
jgi:hypothetical protein